MPINETKMNLEINENQHNNDQVADLSEEKPIPSTTPEFSREEIDEQLYAALKARDNAVMNVNRAKDLAKKLATEVEIQKEFGQDPNEAQAKLNTAIGQVSQNKADAERLQGVVDDLNHQIRKHHAIMQQSEEQQQGVLLVEDIKLPLEPEENPRLYATLIGNMASALQNNLIWGEDYLRRLKMRLDRPDHDTPNGNHGTILQEENEELANRIQAIEEERAFMRMMMFALRQHYQWAYDLRDKEATNFPKFLFRTNDQVRKKADEYNHTRQQQWIEEQKKLRAEGGKFYKEMDVLTMPQL